MAIYSERWPTVYAINTVTELELTTSQNVTNNYTRVSYVVRVKKVNNTNDNWTPASGGSYLTLSIGGNSVRSNYRSNWTTAINSRDVTAVVDSGYTDVYHDADGTKTINFSLSLNPNVTVISNMPNRTISGSFVAATIPRASTFTVGSSLTTGTAYTVSITRASASFTHRVYRKIGDSEVQLTTSAVGTSYDVTMPHSLFNSYPNSTSISASIIVKTFNGTTEIGSKSQHVTINLTGSAIPTNSSTTWSNSNSTPLSSNQMIRGVSRLTLGTGTVAGSYSSTISSYEFSYQITDGDWTSAVSSSTRTYTYPAFNFPASGSVVLNIRSRVKDSRGRYSNWSTATVNSAIRVHHYAPPSIGNISVKRAGSGNTTLQVYRSHSVTPLYQGGSTSGQKNTANLRFQTRELGGSTVSSNTGGTSTSLSTAAAWVNLASAFTANKSYQVRAVLSDARQTVYGSWVTVGTEFVPLDIGPKGIGVGKVHSNGSANLEVGSGGISSEGPLRATTFDVIDSRSLNPNPYTSGSSNRGLSVHFKNSSTIGVPDTSTYSTLFDIQPWNESSGGNHQQIAINSQGEMFGRFGSTSWNAWRKFLKENSNGTATIDGITGGSTVTIGSANSGWVHFVSSNSPFHFNRQISVAGHVYAADANGNGYGSRLARVDEIPSVPAAYAPTSGGSGNNRWIRFPSGHQICWGSTTTTNSTSAVTFPRAFTATPMITVTGHHASHSPSTTLSAANASTATFYIVDGRNGGLWGGSYTSGMTATLRYIAVGIG